MEGLYTKQGCPQSHDLLLSMEIEVVTYATQWLASQRDAHSIHTIILTDPLNLLKKVESGMGCPNWHIAKHSLRLQRLLWIYCPGHSGVSGNELADRLASTADITSDLQLDRTEVPRGLRNFLNMDRSEHHSGRHSTLRGRERSAFNQTNTGIASRTTLGRRGGARMGLPSAMMPS